MKPGVGIWLAAAGALSGAALADIENRNLFPFGEREVLLGNAGTAQSPSTGAVFYNPAGLALLDHPTISVSGSTYLYSKLDVSPIAVADNTNLDYHATGFDAIPATVVSTIESGDWTLALSILVPDSIKLENRLTFPTPNTSTTIVQVVNSSDLWLALSGARYVGDGFALGASLFVMQHRDSQTIASVTRSLANRGVAAVTNSHLRNTVYNLSLTAGAFWQATSFLDVGLRVQTPTVKLGGGADGYTFTQRVSQAGTGFDINENESKDIASRYTLPLDMTLGTKVTFGGGLSLLADLSLQAGAAFDAFPDSPYSSPVDTRATFRANFGLEAELTDSFLLGAGFIYNPSSFRTIEGRKEGASYRDFLGVTGGVSFQSDRVRSGVGLFYLWSSGEYLPYGTTTPGKVSQSGAGATLVFAYML